MISAEILAVIGTLILIAISANAYFIRELVESINQVKIQTALLIQKESNFEERINHLEMEARRHLQYTQELKSDLASRVSILELMINKSKSFRE